MGRGQVLHRILTADEEFIQLVSHITSQTGVHTVVLDADGNRLYGPVEGEAVCLKCRQTCGACCQANWKSLYSAAKNSREPVIGSCPESGMATAALPIYVEGELLNVWVLCQFALDSCKGKDQPAWSQGPLPVMTAETLNYQQLLITALSQPIVRLENSNLELEQLSQAMYELAYVDPTLGLPNRNQLFRDMSGGIGGCFLFLDVVDLAKVNDAYGRRAGDELLRALRDHLLALDIAGSKLYRLLAADFGLWIPEFHMGDLLKLAVQLQKDCSEPWSLRDEEQAVDIAFHAAVGILPVGDQNFPDLESITAVVSFLVGQAADSGEITVFKGGADDRYYRRLRLEVEMRRAVRRGMEGFSVVYQPIIDLGNALWKGVEALCRWKSEEFGHISPEEFIPIAESLGLIGDLGLWVLEESVRQICELELGGTDQFVLDVNISPAQLADSELGDRIISIIRRYDYPPHKLCLEITESSDLNFSGPLLKTLEQLSGTGIRFALDDFGVGYASLSNLYKLPVDVIKTDRSLIENVENNIFLQRLFYVMGELAHVNGMKIVAEGVETEAQVQVLLMEGADFLQGYLFSRPIGPSELRDMRSRFYNSMVEKPTLEYSRKDLIGMRNTQSSYVLPPALYSVLNQCMNILFTGLQTDKAIDEVLRIVGESLNVSRAYVYLHDHGERYVLAHEWIATGNSDVLRELDTLYLSDLGPRWLQKLLTEEMLVAADTSTLPKEIRATMEQRGIKAFAEFALIQDGKPIGTVNFNDCKGVRYWSREDIRMLQLLANMLASVLQKADLVGQIEQQNQRLQSILDQIDAVIYVVDPESGELLFTNRYVQQALPNATGLPGRICWETFQNRDSRCSFCPVEKLLANPARMQHLEMYLEANDSYMQVAMSLIQWQKQKKGVLCYAYNITEIKDRQRKLEMTASLDPLTQIYNRAGFNALAKRLLQTAAEERRPTTLAFLDVDGLKKENDRRGHRSGDALLNAIVECLKRRTRDSDLIGRHGGDEFVVLFSNCTCENAAKSLEAMLKELSLLDEPDIDRHHSFSYGLAGSDEAVSQEGQAYLDELIAIADERMLEHKNIRHGGGRGGSGKN